MVWLRVGWCGLLTLTLLLALTRSVAADTPQLLIRGSCDEIRGTEYISWEERDWFLANCLVPVHIYALSISQVQTEFTEGWLAGGGDPDLLYKVYRIIYCESKWDRYAYNPIGGYTGLGQWDSSWYSYGGGDIYSPWQQGFNMATRVIRSGGFYAWECQ